MAYVMEGTDVGMIQARDGTGFSLKSFPQFSTISKMVRQNFDGDDTVQTGVFGAVNLTHPSGTHSGEDFIGP
jgi:hypothetical protein